MIKDAVVSDEGKGKGQGKQALHLLSPWISLAAW